MFEKMFAKVIWLYRNYVIAYLLICISLSLTFHTRMRCIFLFSVRSVCGIAHSYRCREPNTPTKIVHTPQTKRQTDSSMLCKYNFLIVIQKKKKNEREKKNSLRCVENSVWQIAICTFVEPLVKHAWMNVNPPPSYKRTIHTPMCSLTLFFFFCFDQRIRCIQLIFRWSSLVTRKNCN